nr:uncharacterized protein LOC107452923 [Parasteatoda tepidariorum]
MCLNFKGSKKDLKIHFEADHDIDIEEETLPFESENDFVAWKAKLENDNAVSYVKERGVAHTTTGVEKQFFICNRSGYYKYKGKGLRHLKTQGSRKINGYCPAGFTVNSSADGCLLKYIKTYIGHTNEIGHLSLTEEERSFFAAKIATGISFNKILDGVRDNIPPSGIRRVHLLTNKDLHNIQMEFEVEAFGLKSDAASIDLWVNHKDNKDALFYKFQENHCPKHQNLQSYDFVLIIMTEAQKEMLTKYAPECIYIDSTHGTNAYDFQLTTLLVLDDMRQGPPCDFMISSKVNQDTCAVLFNEIKDVLGDISTAIFMSDMADSYYNAWLLTFHTIPTNRLYCAWHVDNAWRNNLNKIKNDKTAFLCTKF